MNILSKNWQLSDVDGVIITLSPELHTQPHFTDTVAFLSEKELLDKKPSSLAHSRIQIDGRFIETVFVVANDHFCNKFMESLAGAYKKLKDLKVKNIGVDLSAVTEDIKKYSRAVGEVFTMADYDFDDYKSDRKPSTVENIFITGIELDEKHFAEGLVLGQMNIRARRLINEPANSLTPTKLAEIAKTEGEALGLEVEVKGLEEIKALGMDAFLSVARGSNEEPKLIVMRHLASEHDHRLAIVGKGLTYDSGGYSIKPTNSMLTMKDDMSGAAAVISAMLGIAKLGIKANVVAVVAACENLISGKAYKPGDIISSMGGKSIFIGNTDAEGRLTLVDAVTYAIEKENATHVLDICTLTGAAVVATGHVAAPVLSNNEDFYELTKKSFSKASEKIWRFPIFDEYKELLKHPEADLTNSAGNPGTITAGLFIEAFVGSTPWVHVDIAGTAWWEKGNNVFSRGGTGSGVRPLIHLAKKFAKF